MENLQDIQTSYELIGYSEYFNSLVKLYDGKNFPKSLLISGKKGIGKYTLVNHLLTYIYDKTSYNLSTNVVNKNSIFFKQFKCNSSPNVISLNNKKNKIENIRELKLSLSKTSLNNQPRFIILDDVETFNHNSLNALLKIIEEPTASNYFILIDNNKKSLLETVKSRCILNNLFLSNSQRIKSIEKLLEIKNIDPILDYKKSNLTPGNYIIFNQLLAHNKINLNENLVFNIDKILKLYKKNKDLRYIDLSIFLIDQFYSFLLENNVEKFEVLNDTKIKILKNINNFVQYNLNLNLIINSINTHSINAK